MPDKCLDEDGSSTALLLAIEDVTQRRDAEREKDELLRQKEVLLQEMQHRVANSLQIIASILLLKAKTVQSEEICDHLQRCPPARHVGGDGATTAACLWVERKHQHRVLFVETVREFLQSQWLVTAARSRLRSKRPLARQFQT